MKLKRGTKVHRRWRQPGSKTTRNFAGTGVHKNPPRARNTWVPGLAFAKPGFQVDVGQGSAAVSSIRMAPGTPKVKRAYFERRFAKNMPCSDNDTFRTNIRKKYVIYRNLRTVEFQNPDEKSRKKICRNFGSARKERRKNREAESEEIRNSLIDYQKHLSLFLKAISHFYFSKQHIFNERISCLWCTSVGLFYFF